MSEFINRRVVIASLGAVGVVGGLSGPAFALTSGQATSLVTNVVADINAIIASGKSESAMIADFEGIFSRYADVPTIARYVLGVEARSASPAQLQGFTDAFQGYISRRYGRRFREFIGGRIEVLQARPVKSWMEVETTAILQGLSPFRLDFHVSDRSGAPKFFNIIIEGINMLLSERTEIGAMLDQRRGSLDQLIVDIQRLG